MRWALSCASTEPMEARVDSEAVGAAATERAWPSLTSD